MGRLGTALVAGVGATTVMAKGTTIVPSGIPTVDNHFPAGLLDWSTKKCGSGIDFCGTLDFCQDSNGFGYALPGDKCHPFSGPTIRLTPGHKYKVTLRNLASPGVTTNLHTHGLHVVGAGDSDDVTRSVSFGECLDYVWDIDSDQGGGTHWYHSHMHRISERQVGGGAFGLIIIEDNPRINPDLPLWASYERVIQIFRNENKYLANGETSYDVTVERNRWFRLRVSVIDLDGLISHISIDGCQFMKVATDGIWASVVPQPPRRSYPLTGSSRSDFVVQCPNISNYPIRYNGREVGRVVTTHASSQHIALEQWRPQLPPSLQSLREAVVPRQNMFDVTMSSRGVNGRAWNKDVPLHTIAYDEVHEWSIWRSDVHPFHMHLYHVMVVSRGGCGEMHQEGEIYDTISGADFEGRCRIRFKTADFGQRDLLHCHVFRHSDQGAMGWVNVVGDAMPMNTVDSPSYQCSAASPPSKVPTARPSRRPTARPSRRPTAKPSQILKKTPSIETTTKPKLTPIETQNIHILSDGHCSDIGCGECEGDCDNDSDCYGGLECFKRKAYEFVPGCDGRGSEGAIISSIMLLHRQYLLLVSIFFWSLTQFFLSTCCQTATDYCYNHSNSNNPVYRMAWEDLSLAQRKAAKSLGYNKKSWKRGDFDESHKVWADLKSEDREAATMLGYTELSWNRVVRDAGD